MTGATGVEPAAFGFGGSRTLSPVFAECERTSAALAPAAHALGGFAQDSPLYTQPALSRGPLLRADQVAELLGVCAATVYRICARGELVHTRVGNNMVRIARADLEHYLAHGKARQNAPAPRPRAARAKAGTSSVSASTPARGPRRRR
ncbi:MAG: helix-turn-helix domain-containing protein [Myxococcales bacterium]